MTDLFNKLPQKKFRSYLRKNMTTPEIILWLKLQKKQMMDCKFRRQYGIENFVLDFYSPELKLAIEIDGDSHYEDKGKILDAKKEKLLSQIGIHILRFKNYEVMKNLEGVLEAITNHITFLTSPS